MPVLLGIDGCRAGWACVAEDTAARTLEAQVVDPPEQMQMTRFDGTRSVRFGPLISAETD